MNCAQTLGEGIAMATLQLDLEVLRKCEAGLSVHLLWNQTKRTLAAREIALE